MLRTYTINLYLFVYVLPPCLYKNVYNKGWTLYRRRWCFCCVCGVLYDGWKFCVTAQHECRLAYAFIIFAFGKLYYMHTNCVRSLLITILLSIFSLIIIKKIRKSFCNRASFYARMQTSRLFSSLSVEPFIISLFFTIKFFPFSFRDVRECICIVFCIRHIKDNP